LGFDFLGGVVLHKKGYTIIELVMVISILGILATVSLPIYRESIAHYRHSMALRMIVYDIRLIQQKSISEKKSYKLIFNTNADGANLLHDYWLVYEENVFESRQLPDGNHVIETDFENDTLTFKPSGEPSQGGHITVSDALGNKSYIVVAPATGRVKISDELS